MYCIAPTSWHRLLRAMDRAKKRFPRNAARSGWLTAAAPDRLLAPADCTNIAALDEFIRTGMDRLRNRSGQVILDLSLVRTMNSALLAAVIFLARESRDAGGRVRLASVPAQFKDWAATLGVWNALVHRGIVDDMGPAQT
jgi:hypothetical protein